MASSEHLALCAAMSIASPADQAPPEWLHLMPAGEARTFDGRGPYRVADARALVAASLRVGEKLVVDENHATDLAAPKGLAAPAHAWIVELQARGDGIWGRVQWVDTAAGIWRHYRGLSPVIAHLKDGTVTAILRASLTNTPNINGLHSLHSKGNDMDFKARLIDALELPGTLLNDDAGLLSEVMRLCGKEAPKRGATEQGVSLQAAQDLAHKAAGYVKRMADAGLTISHAQAVRAVPDGRTML